METALIPRGTSVLAAVGQNPGGPSGNLSTLVPLAYLDGEPTSPKNFPYHGLIFWYMTRKEVVSLFLPGMLVVASIESGVVPETVPPIDRHQYRVESDSVREPSPSEAIEIIDYATRRITHPRELLLANDVIISHKPLPQVYVRTSEAVYGPFNAESRLLDASTNDFSLVLRLPEDKVGLIELKTIESIANAKLTLDVDAAISLRTSPPHKSGKVVRCTYQLICAPGIVALREADKQYVFAKTPEQVLKPLTRKYLERNRFQHVQGMFEEFVNYLGSEREALTLTQTEVIESVQAALDRDRRLIREFTDAILSSGLLDTSIEERIKVRTDQYITDKTAEISSTIREKTRNLQLEMEALEKSRVALEAEIATRSRQALKQIEADRSALQAECETERQKLNTERVELDEKRNELTRYMQDLTDRYTNSRDKVINDYLAMMPLLERTNLVQSQRKKEEVEITEPSRDLIFPAFCLTGAGEYEPVSEIAFFERFVAHVESRGYKYRDVDLISFHQNFKTSEFFVLGGVSGTDKSSLPQLYAEALAGDNADGVGRFLRVAVNPTWLEVNDVLGRVNVLDRTFNPTETGLFRHLVFAETETLQKQSDSGLWPIVLDEMNLAQVEHYFGPFLQVFGMGENRTVSVFDPSAVSPRDPFHRWAKLTIPKSVRFIGTVNFDETTKQLSLRLLDRGPLTRIDIASQSTNRSAKKASGPPIMVRHFQDWVTHTEIGRAAPQLLDDLNQHLKQLGCPFNPRRRNAIDAFLANSNPSICSPEQAFDIAVSQRVLSLVRGLFRESARGAFESLKKVILESNMELPECERVLAEIASREFNLFLTT